MRWWFRLRKRRNLDQVLEDEVAFHRAMRARDLDPPPFGNATQIKEGIRDMWTLGWLEALLADGCYALRGMRRDKAFAALSRILEKEQMLFGVSPQDGLTLAAGAGLLGLVTLVASLVPAWRAAGIDPMRAIRAE